MGVKSYEGTDKLFLTAVSLAKPEHRSGPGNLQTMRQYRKWKRGDGLAIRFKNQAQEMLAGK